MSHNVFAEPMFDLCRESGVAEKRKCQGLVPFGNGAISKVENAAKFGETSGSFWLFHVLCKSPKCVDIPVCGCS